MSSQKSKTFTRNSIKTFSIGDNIEIGKQTENNNQKEIIKDYTDNKEYLNIVNNTIGDGKDLQSSGRSQRREYINKSDIFKEDRDKFFRHELHKKIIRDLYNFDTQAKQEKLEQVKRYLNGENFDHYCNILTQKQLQAKTSCNQVTNSTVHSSIETPKEAFFYYQNKLNCIKAANEQPIQCNNNNLSPLETKVVKHKQLGSVPEFNRPENEKTFRKFINERQQQEQTSFQQGQQDKAICLPTPPHQLQNKTYQNNESEIEIISNRTYNKEQPEVQIRYKNFEYGKSKDRKKSESSKEKEDRKLKNAINSYRSDINDGKTSIINSSKSSFIYSSNYSISLPKIPSSLKTDSKLKIGKYIKESKKCPKSFQQLEKIDEKDIRKQSLENKINNKKDKNGYDRVVKSLQKHSHEFRKLQYETIKQSVQHLEQLDKLAQKSLVSI